MAKPTEPWVFSDPHLGHEKMITDCGRPVGFEDRILEALAKIPPEDLLICLGDVCIGQDAEWHHLIMSAFGGKKWLVLGNHDHRSWGWYMRAGWDFVGHSVGLEMFGKRILLTHRPKVPCPEGVINVHGHLHNTGKFPDGYDPAVNRLVLCEHTYSPVRLRSIVEPSKKTA